jgi:hypothetical protein
VGKGAEAKLELANEQKRQEHAGKAGGHSDPGLVMGFYEAWKVWM